MEFGIFFPNFLERLCKVTRESEGRMIPFGIVMFINFPLFHLLLLWSEGTFYSNLSLRLSASLFCLPLIIKDFWPKQLKPLLPFYWHFTIFYCLPFFFTFMTLKSHLSTIWLMNSVSAMFFMLLILDIASFFILLSLGSVSGLIAFFWIGGVFYIDLASVDLLGLSSTYGAAIIIGAIFSYNNILMEKEKILTMKMLAGSIAHELRTPLSAMKLDADTLSHYLPYYQEAYAKAKGANLPLTKLRANELDNIGTIPENLQSLSRNAHTMINLLLTNLNEGSANQQIEQCSMKLCVDEAMSTYPFSLEERELVHWNTAADFSFLGHTELTKHILFNLIKNALYAIASAGKGGIYITIEPGETSKDKGRLIFKDTGPGITPSSLPHIFDRFYTRTSYGTGIGLAFCKSAIEGFGGEITCTSKVGAHTTFAITLPVVEEETLQAA